ncbi:MAG: hypothetical protein Ta2A_25800 [Treponemataceae bacterium]|nr:MAG: hypothetical protein Ta2A_25800 [Treponemataceae bacterium]
MPSANSAGRYNERSADALCTARSLAMGAFAPRGRTYIKHTTLRLRPYHNQPPEPARRTRQRNKDVAPQPAQSLRSKLVATWMLPCYTYLVKNFIVFEGIDGSGTSTQIQLLKNSFTDGAFGFTAEPTSLETGIFLRRILSGAAKTTAETRAFLFAADRYEHVYGNGGIIETLDSGKTVVCDRYLFSSLAYQGIECGEALPRTLNADFPLPEYVFFFDIDAKSALERIALRGEKTEIYEKLGFLEKTVDAYRGIIARYEKNPAHDMKIIRVDALLPPETISQTIILPILKKTQMPQ